MPKNLVGSAEEREKESEENVVSALSEQRLRLRVRLKKGNAHVGGRLSDLAMSTMLGMTVLMPLPWPSTYAPSVARAYVSHVSHMCEGPFS